MLKSIIALSAGLVGGAHAFWRMECPGRVGLARLDPIVNPGSLSKHVHAIHGSSGKLDQFKALSCWNMASMGRDDHEASSSSVYKLYSAPALL